MLITKSRRLIVKLNSEIFDRKKLFCYLLREVKLSVGLDDKCCGKVLVLRRGLVGFVVVVVMIGFAVGSEYQKAPR